MWEIDLTKDEAMQKPHKAAEIERPELKNCLKSGFQPNSFSKSATEYMIRLNSGGGWRRVHFANTQSDVRPEALPETEESYFYIKHSDGSRTVIEFPDEFFGR